jgi:hypothetical protein
MTSAAAGTNYHPTESKYKGGAHEMYVTYDLEQNTRGGQSAMYPKVKRVYIAGDVKDWEVGTFKKRSGREAYGVKIDYEQTREGYHRESYSAERGETHYEVRPADVRPTAQTFTQIVELPTEAQNIQFHEGALPEKYRDALQDIR